MATAATSRCRNRRPPGGWSTHLLALPTRTTDAGAPSLPPYLRQGWGTAKASGVVALVSVLPVPQALVPTKPPKKSDPATQCNQSARQYNPFPADYNPSANLYKKSTRLYYPYSAKTLTAGGRPSQVFVLVGPITNGGPCPSRPWKGELPQMPTPFWPLSWFSQDYRMRVQDSGIWSARKPVSMRANCA